jgi:hypothetical protein
VAASGLCGQCEVGCEVRVQAAAVADGLVSIVARGLPRPSGSMRYTPPASPAVTACGAAGVSRRELIMCWMLVDDDWRLVGN